VTTPKVETKYVKGDRWYIHSASGNQVPGVSAIKEMLPSSALSGWFKKFTAEYCVDHIEEVRALAAKDREGAIGLVKGATDRHSKAAASKGTDIHTLSEQLMRDKMAGVKSTFRATKDEMRYLRNLARFIQEFDVVPEMLETTVWSQEHDYAGTFDFMGYLKGYDGLSIVDYKSGQSGVYPEAGIQQTGYKWADSYIDEDGNFVPMPKVERAFGLWLRPDGWALYPLRTDELMWEHFLHLRASYRFKVEVSPTVVGKPVNENPLKKKWRGNR
jgi:hypothetical protein